VWFAGVADLIDSAVGRSPMAAGLRADELLRANICDVRRSDDGAVIHVRGKGGKDRRIPVESALVDVLEDYLHSRAVRFPNTIKRRLPYESPFDAWSPTAPLFVGPDGERITRGTLQYRVLRAFRRAGVQQPRRRPATRCSAPSVSTYPISKIREHERRPIADQFHVRRGRPVCPPRPAQLRKTCDLSPDLGNNPRKLPPDTATYPWTGQILGRLDPPLKLQPMPAVDRLRRSAVN
jgi:hypothetical protein